MKALPMGRAIVSARAKSRPAAAQRVPTVPRPSTSGRAATSARACEAILDERLAALEQVAGERKTGRHHQLERLRVGDVPPARAKRAAVALEGRPALPAGTVRAGS